MVYFIVTEAYYLRTETNGIFQTVTTDEKSPQVAVKCIAGKMRKRQPKHEIPYKIKRNDCLHIFLKFRLRNLNLIVQIFQVAFFPGWADRFVGDLQLIPLADVDDLGIAVLPLAH